MPTPYLVRFLVEPPPLDGRWDQGSWAAAEVIGPFLRHDGTTARYPTEARLGYDDEYLYAAFYCLDDDIWGTFRQRDQPLYDEEVVEVYLDVDEDGRNYFEFELSPHNVVFDCINSWRNNR
ncbi:MAG: carbohydrate-binding family 9-like protein [Armatimonadetes bacterium]|nr:carbohydrate-binding family 9-like protein [Armatimonadota bacterium]